MQNMDCFLFPNQSLTEGIIWNNILKNQLWLHKCLLYVYLYQWIYLMQICFPICKLVFNLKYNACHSTFNAIYMPCTCNDDKIPSTGSYVARSERLIKNESKVFLTLILVYIDTILILCWSLCNCYLKNNCNKAFSDLISFLKRFFFL